MKNKVLLITGSSRGIGKTCAKLFAKHNYDVIINYNKNKKEAENLLQEISTKESNHTIIKMDISNPYDIKKCVNKLFSFYGKIDVLINNAGISSSKLIQDYTFDEIQKIVDTNLTGALNLTSAIVPSMISNKEGKIINISSIWGNVGGSMESIYSASKGGLIAFTKALAKELGPSNINVNCICPGVIQTDMMKSYSKEDLQNLKDATPLNKLGNPQDIANLALFLSSNEASFITGQIITEDGGFTL